MIPWREAWQSMVKNPISTLDNCEQADEVEAQIRLFREAPRGVVVNPVGNCIFKSRNEKKNKMVL
ncbi:hypothetical protein Syun_008989 [Stephania yunnanensis]|uniref:Uncharacterized protein n=1 Tax=Stephania yunnanensis TaxID=152371 RepID=A0AAP0KER7_9MAGN